MRYEARSCSIDASAGTLHIVLTVDIAGEAHQVAFSQSGEVADKYVAEMHKQARLGLKRDNDALRNEVAAVSEAKLLVEADLSNVRQDRDDAREKHARAVDEKTALAEILADTQQALLALTEGKKDK
jgi:hypothetical protein